MIQVRNRSRIPALVCVIALAVTLSVAQASAGTPGGAATDDSTWYLAEGSTNWGFDCYLSITNPTTSTLTAGVTFNTSAGPVPISDITLPGGSRTVINPYDILGPADFSTRIICRQGWPIAVDREMFWTTPGMTAEQEGAHGSIGVTAPATTWYLAEGSTSWGFECFLLIQNPGAAVANCNVTYMIEGEGPRTVPHQVQPYSRATFNMRDDIGEKDASIQVSADVPVIPERAMYRNNRREGHDSIGTTTPSTAFYLAEGTTGYGFTTYILIQNPNAAIANVMLTYMKGDGTTAQQSVDLPPASRKTVRVNDKLGSASDPAHDFSSKVECTNGQRIIAERSMYWNNGTGEAMHDTIGLTQPHERFFLPDGRTDTGFETWTLVQNPGAADVGIEVVYLPQGGGVTPGFEAVIPRNSRVTYSMRDTLGPDAFASIMVRTTTGGLIMVERSIYGHSRGSGTNTIGAFYDTTATAGPMVRAHVYRPGDAAAQLDRMKSRLGWGNH